MRKFPYIHSLEWSLWKGVGFCKIFLNQFRWQFHFLIYSAIMVHHWFLFSMLNTPQIPYIISTWINPFNVLMYFICFYFVENFCIYVYKGLLVCSCFFFSCDVLSGFGISVTLTSLNKVTLHWKCYLLCFFYRSMRKQC